jgi:hypothetical protein
MTAVRVAAHVHSEWSYDATWPLAAIADAFARRHYDVVLMAEHDRGFDERRWEEYGRACAEASDHRILVMPGMEYEDADSVVHVPVWGEAVPFLGSARPTLEMLRDARTADGFAVFAHPWRRDAISRYRSEWAPFLHAVEIWNRHYDGLAPHPDGRSLAEAEGLRPFVALDFHTRRQFFPLALTVELEGRPTRASVAAALLGGRFRSELARFDALRCTGALPGATLRGAEIARKRVRTPVRRLQRRLGWPD